MKKFNTISKKFTVLLLLMITFVFMIYQGKSSYAKFTVPVGKKEKTIEGRTDIDNLIEKNMDDYLNMSYKYFKNKTFKDKWTANGYKYETCFDHQKNDKKEEDITRKIIGVVDVKFNTETGKYDLYYDGKKTKNNYKYNAELAYLIAKRTSDLQNGIGLYYNGIGYEARNYRNVAIVATVYELIKKKEITPNSSFIKVFSENEYIKWAESGSNETMKGEGGRKFDPVKYRELRQEAQTYSQLVADFSPLTNKTKSTAKLTIEKTNEKTNVYKYGPLKVSYGGKNIKDVKLLVNDKSVDATIKYQKVKNDDKWHTDLTKIPNNEEFYLQITTSADMLNNKSSIKITQDSIDRYVARMLLCYGEKAIQQTGVIAGRKEAEPFIGELTFNIEKTPTGDLTINKTDSKDKNVKLNAGFKIYVETDGQKGWLSGEGTTKSPYKYNNKVGNAKVYSTNNGTITLKNLQYGKYTVYEVKEPDGYKISDQANYDTKNKWVKFTTKTLNEKNKTITYNLTNKKPETPTETPTGSLTINKKDSKTGAILNGAGFIIQTEKGWLSGEGTTNSPYKYDNKEVSSAKEFTATNGTVTINNLKYGKYTVYEVTPPKGYKLSDQGNQYKAEGNNGKGWVEFGEQTLNEKNKTITYNLTNTPPPDTKIIPQDRSISGYVFVDTKPSNKADKDKLLTDKLDKMLKGVKVSLVNKSTGKEVKTTTTNDNGYYEFKDVLKEDESYANYYVKFDYTGLAEYKDYKPIEFNASANGSKALIDSIPESDKDFKGIATTYAGTDKTQEGKYGLSYLYNTLYSDKTLKNINLGLDEPYKPDYTLTNQLESVKIKINGYTYKYKYGQKENKEAYAAPKVNWQGKSVYSRDIYPADANYKASDQKDNLQVYVKYKIAVKNTENQQTDTIKEIALHITSLQNTFDSNRYELNDNNWELSGNNNTAKLKDLGNFKTIQPNQVTTTYIEFKVKDEEIDRVLKNPEGVIEKEPTSVTTIGYHEYNRKEQDWNNNTLGFKKHTSNEIEHKQEATYLRFKLGEDRAVTGKVFEDKSAAENQAGRGNGLYDNNENIVTGVKVELLNSDKSTLAKVYDGKGNFIEGVVTTNSNGIYTIKGLVPGKYYLRFTYGDGSQKIVDKNGKEIKGSFKGKEYESTDIASEVNQIINTKAELWYKNSKILNGEYSVVKDDEETRKTVNSNNTGSVTAYTELMSITVENTDGDEIFVEEEEALRKKKETILRTYGGLYFGIIERFIPEVTVDKRISNISLVKEGGQVTFNGNPAVDTMTGVSDLSENKNKNGSTFVRAELPAETIYGSRLTLTYTITVTNETEYQKNNNMKVDVDIVDTLDNTLVYVPEKSTTDVITKKSGTDNQYNIQIKDLDTKNNPNGNANTKTVTMVAYRTLAAGDDDMEMINNAQVVKVTDKTSNLSQTYQSGEESADAKITVIPPTGEDKITKIVYTALALSALIVIAGRIIIIKRKTL